ncbi:hypothetical protein RKE57_19900 [Stenotrophomonas geniculata]|uniref:hypothetical protein n=1 Tax=Stenotrophomonas geniculata TaxID=86188 RepID=UPI00287FDBE8|nr:hypothetical protein [Stenotrophomonas geniculata]WNF10297.1 hypothetical protein RKE57_19900 [Stenotrophomonas geniculata]
MPHLPGSISKRAFSVLAKIGEISEVSKPSIELLDQDEILSKSFSFLELEMRGMRLLLACSRGGYKLDWIVARHLAYRTSGLYDIVTVSAENLVATERLALMSAGLSYIIIDREIFIPDLNVNTAERPPDTRPGAKLSVATQAVLTHALNSGKCRYEVSGTLAQLAIPLKQLSCVSQEIVIAGIGAVDRFGARSHVEMDECSVTWARVEPVLSTPIIDVLRVRTRSVARLGQMRIAGEAALPWRECGQDEHPRHLAVHQRLLRSTRRNLSPDEADSFAEVEIWNRCPARLSPHSTQVDPISLYLCRRRHATLAELGRLRQIISERW